MSHFASEVVSFIAACRAELHRSGIEDGHLVYGAVIIGVLWLVRCLVSADNTRRS